MPSVLGGRRSLRHRRSVLLRRPAAVTSVTASGCPGHGALALVQLWLAERPWARRRRPPTVVLHPAGRRSASQPCTQGGSAAPPRGYTRLSEGFRCHCLGGNGSITIRTNDAILVRRATAWLDSNHLAPEWPQELFELFDFLFNLVGRTGFEPVTFSVSGRRAPAAPTARDDESLPGRARCCATGTGARERASRTFATPPTQASIRGSPNRAMVLLSTNRVTAEIRSPSSVSTIIPCARNTEACGSCR